MQLCGSKKALSQDPAAPAPCYGESCEPPVTAISPRGSRGSQPLVSIQLFLLRCSASVCAHGFHQQVRERARKSRLATRFYVRSGSPVSDGGRGLKRAMGLRVLKDMEGSPVSDGGRGLKQLPGGGELLARGGFARQRWRAWIETRTKPRPCADHPGFARQRWRAWIETSTMLRDSAAIAWFARQRWRAWIETIPSAIHHRETGGSPVSDGGRGLKLRSMRALRLRRLVRPSAMAGVD